jgi:hypothetical protein
LLAATDERCVQDFSPIDAERPKRFIIPERRVHLASFASIGAVAKRGPGLADITRAATRRLTVTRGAVLERNSHRSSGVTAEITFDTKVAEEGQPYVDGCYRRPSGNWHVFYFTS